jgi:hypothetical protein
MPPASTNTNTINGLNGNFKEIYGPKLKDVRLKGFKFQNDFPFDAEHTLGDSYHQPVILQHEHGFTYALHNAGPFLLNEPIPTATQDATINGAQMMLRSWMDVETAARGAEDKNVFLKTTKLLIKEMVMSFKKRSEIGLVRGRQGLGQLSAASGSTITISAATWSAGAWVGAKGMNIHIVSDASGTGTVRGATSLTDSATVRKVTAVNPTTRVITLDATIPTGTVANDYVYPFGQITVGTFPTQNGWNIPIGLHDILTTTSGNLFGISATDYSDLWTSSSYNVGNAPLTFEKVNQAVVLAVSKGLEEDLCLYMSPRTWADVLAAETAVRRWNKRQSPYEVGGDSIKFYSQNGMIEIKTSLFVPEGFAYLIAPKLFSRIGSTEMTFNLPGRGDEFFLHVPDYAAFEIRCYQNWSLFTDQPGHSVILTGIVNAS